MQDMAKGATVNALPPSTDTNVSLGISVAVDALQDGKKEVALASLKTVVNQLENNIDKQ